MGKKSKSSNDPLRDLLAAALREAKEANDAANRRRTAIARARGRIEGELRQAVVTAEAGVEQAQRAHAGALARAAVDGKEAPQSGVKAARQRLADARDDLESEKGAIGQLEDELSESQHVAREKSIAAEAAISKVLALEVKGMVQRAEEILEPFWPLRSALLDAIHASVMEAPGADSLANQRSMKPFDEVLHVINAAIGPLTKREPPSPPDRNYWRVARERLRADPYAELPDVAGDADTTEAVDAA